MQITLISKASISKTKIRQSTNRKYLSSNIPSKYFKNENLSISKLQAMQQYIIIVDSKNNSIRSMHQENHATLGETRNSIVTT